MPTVDPADLRSRWMMQRDVQANTAGQLPATSVDFFEHACSPGADVQATWYRVAMLQLLARPMAMLSSWLHDGIPADAVFQVAAVFPMKRMAVGLVREGLPFNGRGFLTEIEKQSNR